MTGWTYKEITTDDLKFPLVYGEGKRSRLLATIGVTRSGRSIQTCGEIFCLILFQYIINTVLNNHNPIVFDIPILLTSTWSHSH